MQPITYALSRPCGERHAEGDAGSVRYGYCNNVHEVNATSRRPCHIVEMPASASEVYMYVCMYVYVDL